jgi:hypothetical protein
MKTSSLGNICNGTILLVLKPAAMAIRNVTGCWADQNLVPYFVILESFLKSVSACRLTCQVCEMVRGSSLIPNEPNHIKKAANSTAELAENRMPLRRVHRSDLRCRGLG